MATATKLACLHCPYWLETSILGVKWAERMMASHVRRKHPSRPTLVPAELPPGSVQSDPAALDARAPLSVPCRKCGLMLVDHGGRDHGYEPPSLAAVVEALVAGTVRPPLASNHEAVLDFKFRGTATEFRAWCRAYVDGGTK